MFTIQSIVMAQKLKGTLSFIAKVFPGAPGTMVSAEESTLLWALAPLPCPSGCQASQERECMSGATPQLRLLFSQDDEGATHEKLDFRLHFSCSSYLITTPCYRYVCLHSYRNTSQGREGTGVTARCEVEVT